MKEHKLICKGETVFSKFGYYDNGRLAITYISAGGPFAKLTVNIPEVDLADDEILVKTWSENKNISEVALKSGLFTDTGRRIPCGFCEAQIWKFNPPRPRLGAIPGGERKE